MKRFHGNIVAASAAALMLAACGGTSTAQPASNLPTSIGPGEGALNLVAWTGYVESGKTDPKVDWVTPFTTQTGCKINVKFADTSDEMVTLMRQGGGTQWDGVSASGDATNRLIAHGDVAEVNVNLVPDFKDVIQSLQSPRHNTINGHHYGVPYMYGPNVLMYNTQVVKPAPTSWKDTWETSSPYKGKIAAYDSPIFIADAALYLKAHNKSLGITDVYELTSKQLDAAIVLLKQQAPMIKKYWAATPDETDPFSSGDMVIGTAWPYQVSFLKSENKPVASLVPSEGATGWADTWMMSSHAQHPNCMYQWMKWTEKPAIQDQVAEFYGADPSNAKSCDLLRQHIGASADSDYHCGDNTFLKNIALWKTPLQQCGDSRGASCTDYSVWAQRWQEVRGTK
ncbi:MAG: ABC transporter substrate-binding protein [Chloroflexi bacterium]|nr:MAG: ABC transporter substrate-binding protein [Chloroflexota bacterium]